MALDFLFGSDPSTDIQTKSTLTPDQQNAAKQLYSYLSGVGSPTNVTPYGGQLAAPLSSLQSTSLAALEQRAMQLGTGDPALQTASQTLTDILGSGPQDWSQYFKTNVETPMIQDYQENIKPGVAARYADQFFGSQRVSADQINERNLVDSITKARASTAMSEYDTNIQQKLSALGLVPSVTAARTNELMNTLSAGAVPQQTQQTADTAAYQEFLRQQQTQQNRASLLASFLGIPMQENIVTQNAGTTGLIPGLLEGMAPGIGKAVGASLFPSAGAAGSLASLIGLL